MKTTSRVRGIVGSDPVACEHAAVLRGLRERRGLKQKEAADAAGMAYEAYTPYEQGFVRVTLENLERFARAFEVSKDDLAARLRLGVVAGAAGARLSIPSVRGIPMVGAASAGGCGWMLTNELVPVDYDFVPERDIVAVRVSGECLSPDLNDGDIVFVDVSRHEPQEGHIVFVTGDVDGWELKRFERRDGEPVLVDNQGRELRPDGARVSGVVVGMLRRLH